MIHHRRYGRRLADFAEGQVFEHPWEVTVDDAGRALWAGSFLDATPAYASRIAARALGFRERPIPPMWLLNLAVSFSVHDVSEQAIANLSYDSASFPAACYAGDTLRARSVVLGVRPVSSGDKGVVHVRTEVTAEDDRVVCSLERKALVRGGATEARRPETSVAHAAPASPGFAPGGAPPDPKDSAGQVLGAPGCAPAPPIELLPVELRAPLALPTRWSGFDSGYFEDFTPGDVFIHDTGRTVTEGEHVVLTTLARNSHPLHVDEVYCQGIPPGAGRTASPPGSFARTRVVYGGLVLSWVVALSSRDLAGNALWDVSFGEGAHPRGVLSGDTLYAASQVVAAVPLHAEAGLVTFRTVGVRNTGVAPLLERSAELFTPELGKEDGLVPEKVVELTRTLLVRRAP